jgi:hypothetical protein
MVPSSRIPMKRYPPPEFRNPIRVSLYLGSPEFMEEWMKSPENTDTLLNSMVFDSVKGTFSPYTHVLGRIM